jgi:hypothetical protein
MKVVINRCFGGFSLSAAAVKRLAELQHRPCYFFRDNGSGTGFVPAKLEDIGRGYFYAWDIPNPNEFFRSGPDYNRLSPEEREEQGRVSNRHYLTSRPENRSDPLLVQVVEELGEKAWGECAELKVIEIPDDVKYEVYDYDGKESIHQVHTSWY